MSSVLSQSKAYLTLILISLLIFGMDNFHLLDLPKTGLSYISVPIQYGLYQSGRSFSDKFRFIAFARQDSLENTALKKQIGTILTENAELRRKLAESESLVLQEGSLSPKTFNLLAARPIGVDRFLLIDKGSLDGLKKDDVVVFKDNFIGLIKEVNPKSSAVLLGQDPDSKIAVFSQNQAGRSKGLLQGQFGSDGLMDKILHSEVIAEGDLVYSDGTEGILPRGLIMGKVTQVLERQNEVFKQAKVAPIFDVRDLDLVFVMRND